MSKPITGAVLGLVFGLAIGLWGTYYFGVQDWLGRVCVIASVMLVLQLLGTTIGATIGKPPPDEINP
jgi:VIT1/CCC1 family predicted Fe2+/Mn2+ transporter